MNEVVIAILGGSAGAAIINGAFKLIELAANRKAQKDDKAEAKADNDKLQDSDIAKRPLSPSKRKSALSKKKLRT